MSIGYNPSGLEEFEAEPAVAEITPALIQWNDDQSPNDRLKVAVDALCSSNPQLCLEAQKEIADQISHGRSLQGLVGAITPVLAEVKIPLLKEAVQFLQQISGQLLQNTKSRDVYSKRGQAVQVDNPWTGNLQFIGWVRNQALKTLTPLNPTVEKWMTDLALVRTSRWEHGVRSGKWADIGACAQELHTGAPLALRDQWTTLEDTIDGCTDASEVVQYLMSQFPPSIEREVLLNRAAGKSWISAQLAEQMVSESVASAGTVGSGPANLIFNFIAGGGRSVHERIRLLEDTEANTLTGRELESLEALRAVYSELPIDVRRQVLTSATQSAFVKLKARAERFLGNEYVTRKISELANQITQEIAGNIPAADSFKDLISALLPTLPDETMIRVMVAYLTAPKGASTYQMISLVLQSLGTLEKKAAQYLAESQDLPVELRDALSHFSDKNSPIDPVTIMKGLPDSIRDQIAYIGPILGTGSVKQSNLVRLKDGRECVLAFVHPTAEADINNTCDALAHVEGMGGVANDMRQILLREIDMEQEAEAIRLFREESFLSEYGVQLPQVICAENNAMLRTVVEGDTLAERTRNNEGFSAAERKLLENAFRGLLRSAFKSNLILTDPKSGNISIGPSGPGMFDFGQYVRMENPQDPKLFLDLLVMLAVPQIPMLNRLELIGQVAKLMPLEDGTSSMRTICEILDQCKHLPDPTERVQEFFVAAKLRHIVVPEGFLGAASMLVTLAEGEKKYHLNPVTVVALGQLYLELKENRVTNVISSVIGFADRNGVTGLTQTAPAQAVWSKLRGVGRALLG